MVCLVKVQVGLYLNEGFLLTDRRFSDLNVSPRHVTNPIYIFLGVTYIIYWSAQLYWVLQVWVSTQYITGQSQLIINQSFCHILPSVLSWLPILFMETRLLKKLGGIVPLCILLLLIIISLKRTTFTFGRIALKLKLAFFSILIVYLSVDRSPPGNGVPEKMFSFFLLYFPRLLSGNDSIF